MMAVAREPCIILIIQPFDIPRCHPQTIGGQIILHWEEWTPYNCFISCFPCPWSRFKAFIIFLLRSREHLQRLQEFRRIRELFIILIGIYFNGR